MDSSAGPRLTRILLTGRPGIGKTTICRELAIIMAETKYRFDGFYTTEVSAFGSTNNNRIGFDIVSVNHDITRPLARILSENSPARKPSKARVGNNHVFVKKFETVALPVFDSKADVLLIDEIGEMELFSEKFKKNIEQLFFSQTGEKRVCVIATIPQRNEVPERFAEFFDRLRDDEATKVIEVDWRSSDGLPAAIARMIEEILS